MSIPRDIQGDPVAVLAYLIGDEPCPGTDAFQVSNEDGSPYPIYECITPDGGTVDIGRQGMVEAVSAAISDMRRLGYGVTFTLPTDEKQ